MNLHLGVDRDQAGMELDEFLCRTFPLYSKRFLRRAVRSGCVLVDGQPASPSQRVRRDEVVSVDIDEEEAEVVAPAGRQVELQILYQDASLLVVDKPPDLPVEPDRWDATRPCLLGALQALGGDSVEGRERFRPRLVHRLDTDTSGAVLVAKTVEAERELGRAFEAGQVHKLYLALVEGEHPLDEGEHELLDLPLSPDKRRGGTMVVREGGKPAQTRIAVEQRFRGYTLLRCEPLTGRTHQIRVHLAAAGFPLVVDPLYGRRKSFSLSEFKLDYKRKPGRPETPLIDRLSLHALRIEFPTPDAPERRIAVEAPLPPDFQRVLKQLAKVRGERARR